MAERGFMDVLKEALAALAPGLKDAAAEVGAELNRLGKQGSLEMAQALFIGNAVAVRCSSRNPVGRGDTPVVRCSRKESQHVTRKLVR
jgi:hypothetical protein